MALKIKSRIGTDIQRVCDRVGFDGFGNLKLQARTTPFPTGNVDFKLRLQPESYPSALTLTREEGGVGILNVDGYMRELKFRT